jgi:hypothetical protein
MKSLPEIIHDNRERPKPTTESIKRAYDHARAIERAGAAALENLHGALRLFEHDSTRASIRDLQRARAELVSLRRTQTAALENIDAAIKSAMEVLPRGATV